MRIYWSIFQEVEVAESVLGFENWILKGFEEKPMNDFVDLGSLYR